MRMSSSMYEVFNWNSSPDPPLTPAKHKRASLSLPPTTDIFAVDDKSDSDTRRPMIQRVASGESWCLRSLQENRERSVSVRLKNEYCRSSTSRFVLALVLVGTLSLSLSCSISLRFFFFHLLHYTLYRRMSRSFNTIKAYPALSSVAPIPIVWNWYQVDFTVATCDRSQCHTTIVSLVCLSVLQSLITSLLTRTNH